MSLLRRIGSITPLAATIIACSSTPSVPAGDAGGGTSSDGAVAEAGAGAPCTTDADCSGGARCGFEEALRCSAGGLCVTPVASCQGPEDFCACGGGAAVCVAPGYQSAPINGKIGPCSTDGGVVADGASE